MALPKTILLKGDGIYKEKAAGVAITPGYLIERNATDEFIPHAGAALNAIPMFAKENDVIGKDIDTDYAIGDNVIAFMPQRGAEVYALVPAAAAAIVINDLLESAGDGTLRKVVDEPAVANTVAVGEMSNSREAIVARAVEAVDNSGGGVEARIKVEIV